MSSPEPPYVAVIFTARRTTDDDAGYAAAAARMEALASTMPGYLGIESARGADRLGITVSYWATHDDARAWKANAEHTDVQRLGRERWYEWYTARIAVVEREYSHRSDDDRQDGGPGDGATGARP